MFPLARRLATRLTARRRLGRSGRLDFRRTVRASLGTGGVPLVTHHKPHKPHKPELVVLCDVSGSVAGFAHFTLMLSYALREQFTKVRAFAFIDTVDEVTDFFTPGGDVSDALARMSTEADLVWFDGGWERNRDQWRASELVAMMRDLQPGIVINDRLPGEGDYETPEQFVPAKPPARPWETCMTMNESWAYNPSDTKWKSRRQLIHTLCEVAGKGGNLLLNVGPRGDGSLPDEIAGRLDAIETQLRHLVGTGPLDFRVVVDAGQSQADGEPGDKDAEQLLHDPISRCPAGSSGF